MKEGGREDKGHTRFSSREWNAEVKINTEEEGQGRQEWCGQGLPEKCHKEASL